MTITIPTGTLLDPSITGDIPSSEDSDGSDSSTGMDLGALLGRGELFDSVAEAFGASGGIPTGSLTPEMVLVMLERRLDDLDGQIKLETAAIEQASAESEKLSDILTVLSSIEAGLSDAGATSQDAKSLHDITIHVNGQSYTGQEIGDLISELALHDFPGIVRAEDGRTSISGDINLATMSAYREKFQIQQRKLNSGNEMKMVRLQSAIGQRQQAIQLSTNLVNNINESAMAIIRSIK